MAEPTFDRARFVDSLVTRRLGHTLIVHAATGSTNDDAWDAAMAGAPDGTVVVADHQTRGRGRDGRAWHDSPGRGLALSVLLHPGCEPATLAAAPLVAGLALARGLAALGVEADLKWPNDLLVHGRKLAGILCERRRLAAGGDAIVIGSGVNVEPFAEPLAGARAEPLADSLGAVAPAELRERAVALRALGSPASREDVAAAYLNALEPLWDELAEGGPAPALAAWRARARFWGETVTARTPAGDVSGIAETLDPDGALVLRDATGSRVRIVAGDVLPRDGAAAAPSPAVRS